MAELQDAMFGAGCFWGVEDAFMRMPGVKETEVGFSGGHTENPSYEDVSYTQTGHAEVLHLKFDPDEVSYDDLLDRFWKIHDPTTMNRQGPDIGSQYRSVIFTFNDEQRKAAEASKEMLDNMHVYNDPIVTEILPAGPFYRAEEYHQKYVQKTGVGACHVPLD